MQQPHDQQDDPNRPRGNRPARGARVVTPGELVQGALQQQGGEGDFLGLGRAAGDLVGMAQELEDQASQRAPLRLSGDEPEAEYEEEVDDLGVLNEVDDGEPTFGVPTDTPSPDIYAAPAAEVEVDDDEGGWEGDLDDEEDVEYEQVLVGDGSEQPEEYEESEEFEAETFAADSHAEDANSDEDYGDEVDVEEDSSEEFEFAAAETESEEEENADFAFAEDESEDEFETSYAAEEGVDFGAELSFAGSARPRRLGVLVTLGAGCVVAASLAVVLPVTGVLPFDVPYQVPTGWFHKVGLGSLVRVDRATEAPTQVASATHPAAASNDAEVAAHTPPSAEPFTDDVPLLLRGVQPDTMDAQSPSEVAAWTEPTETAPLVEEPAFVAQQSAEAPSVPAATEPVVAASANDSTPRLSAEAPSVPAPVASTSARVLSGQPIPSVDAPIGPPPPGLAGGAPMGPVLASGGLPSGPSARISTLPGLPTERREGSLVPDEKGPSLGNASVRIATSEDLGQRWTGPEVPPLSRIQAKQRMFTPEVGRVRVVTQRGDVFDGRLDSMGEGQVWIVMSLGNIAISGDTVARIDRLPEGPAPKGRGAATTTSERVRVKTAGGVLVGRVLSRDGNRVTILTDAGGRVTLVDPEIESADQRIPGGVLGGKPPR